MVSLTVVATDKQGRLVATTAENEQQSSLRAVENTSRHAPIV